MLANCCADGPRSNLLVILGWILGMEILETQTQVDGSHWLTSVMGEFISLGLMWRKRGKVARFYELRDVLGLRVNSSFTSSVSSLV